MLSNKTEIQKANDLFFLCSLIEYLGRKTSNRRSYIVSSLGEKELNHLLEYADIYHCDNIDRVSDDMIEKYHISEGDYKLCECRDIKIPTHWDIGKVYSRLITSIAEEQNLSIVNALVQVYRSWLCEKIDNYNSSMFYENNNYLTASYLAGRPL